RRLPLPVRTSASSLVVSDSFMAVLPNLIELERSRGRTLRGRGGEKGVTPVGAGGPHFMIIADLYECASSCDSCGVRLFRPGLAGDDRDPPTCGCGRPMRPAGYI